MSTLVSPADVTVLVDYEDTPISGVPSLSLTCPALNYPVDFKTTTLVTGSKDTDEKSGVITNMTSTRDRQEKIRFVSQRVANVYSAAPQISPSVRGPIASGRRVIIQNTHVYSAQSSDPSVPFRVDFPLSCQLNMVVPDIEYLTEEMILDLLKRTISCCFDTGTTTSSRLRDLLSGAIVPAGVS